MKKFVSLYLIYVLALACAIVVISSHASIDMYTEDGMGQIFFISLVGYFIGFVFVCLKYIFFEFGNKIYIFLISGVINHICAVLVFCINEALNFMGTGGLFEGVFFYLAFINYSIFMIMYVKEKRYLSKVIRKLNIFN